MPDASQPIPRCQCGNPECPTNVASDLQKENTKLTERVAELELAIAQTKPLLELGITTFNRSLNAK